VKKEDKKLVYSGGIAGFIGSLCCLGPVVLVLLGLTGVSTALSIGKFTWLFNGFGAAFFGGAVFMYLTRKKNCSVQGVKQHWKAIVISSLILVVFLFTLKYLIAPFIAILAYR